MEFKHKPVLLQECIEGLNLKPEGIYVDGTLGGAGHSKKILENISSKGILIGIDIAKETADIILLEKDLNVLEKGVLEGKRYGVSVECFTTDDLRACEEWKGASIAEWTYGCEVHS